MLYHINFILKVDALVSILYTACLVLVFFGVSLNGSLFLASSVILDILNRGLFAIKHPAAGNPAAVLRVVFSSKTRQNRYERLGAQDRLNISSDFRTDRSASSDRHSINDMMNTIRKELRATKIVFWRKISFDILLKYSEESKVRYISYSSLFGRTRDHPER